MVVRPTDSAPHARARPRLLFFTILFFMVASPLFNTVFTAVPVHRIAGQLVLIATLSWLRDRPLLGGLGAALGTVAIVVSWIPAVDWSLVVASASEAGFYAVALAALWARVVQDDRVTEDALYGAVCMLVLIALFFAAVYTFIEALSPGTFALAEQRDPNSIWRQFVYFSFVTLTTLGYGDITPLAPTARSIVSVEAATGVLYSSIVIARLVSLYASGGRLRPRTSPETTAASSPSSREEPKFAVLLAMMLAQILVIPWVKDAFASALLMAIAQTAVLAAGVYAVSRRRSTLVWASLFALPAIIAVTTTVHELPPVWVTVGFLGELSFKGLVIAIIGASVFRARTVHADTILGAVCVYVLLISLWSTAYTFVEWVEPGSFVLPELMSRLGLRMHLAYFSAMTLTTTGFGDISPVTRTADMLVMLQSLAGIVFPAVLVALLVSRQTAASAPYRTDP